MENRYSGNQLWLKSLKDTSGRISYLVKLYCRPAFLQKLSQRIYTIVVEHLYNKIVSLYHPLYKCPSGTKLSILIVKKCPNCPKKRTQTVKELLIIEGVHFSSLFHFLFFYSYYCCYHYYWYD